MALLMRPEKLQAKINEAVTAALEQVGVVNVGGGIAIRVPRAAGVPSIDPDRLRSLTMASMLKKMLDPTHWFCICDFDEMCRTMNVVPDGLGYRLLHSLHCKHWRDMDRETRDTAYAIIVATFTEPEAQP